MANIYIGSVQWTAVAAWTALTPYVSTSNGGRGDYVRQLAAPAVGSERVFRCTVSGTSLAAEPTWNLTKNATTAEAAGPTWTECTGQEADQVSGTWRAPHARMQAAVAATWSAAGDVYYLADDHAETQATAMSVVFPGTLASPNQLLCVRVAAGTVPPVSVDLRATATVTTTGNSNLTLTGAFYSYGVIWNCGSGAVSPILTLGGTTQGDQIFEACSLRLLATTGPTLVLGSSSNSIGTRVIWRNTTYKTASTGAAAGLVVAGGCLFLWENTATAVDVSIATPTNLFVSGSVAGGTAILDGVDLNNMSTKTLVGAIARNGSYFFKDCKFPASLTVNAAPTSAGVQVYVIRSASGATAYNMEKHDVRGDQTVETTIVRAGGVTENGTPLAMKLVATANAKFQAPFESLPIVVRNAVTGSNVTLTVYGIWAGGAIPTNAELWLEIGYLGSASTPLLTFNTSTKKADLLAAAATIAVTDASTWGGSTTKFKWVVTLSAPQPALVGEMYAVVKGATTNATYIDPTGYLS